MKNLDPSMVDLNMKKKFTVILKIKVNVTNVPVSHIMISVRKKIHRIFRKSFSVSEEYPDIRQLALHVTKSHCLVNNDGKTVCLYCTSFQRERIYQVRNHILATHFNQPDHECKLCNKIFIEQFSLNSRKLYLFINTFLLFLKKTYLFEIDIF